MIHHRQPGEDAYPFKVPVYQMALAPLNQLIRAFGTAGNTPVDLAAQPGSLIDWKTNLLQADQIRGSINQLAHQQLAALQPAIGVIAQVDGRYRQFCHQLQVKSISVVPAGIADCII